MRVALRQGENGMQPEKAFFFKSRHCTDWGKDRESITPVRDRRVVCHFRVMNRPKKLMISKELYKLGTEIAQDNTYPVSTKIFKTE